MKKAIKKTCVVLLLFALLVSQVAASYSETGTLNEGTSAISAAERYLSNWAYNSYMYADKNLTLGTVLDAEVDPAKLTLATSEFMALRNDADGQENNISVAVSKMQANIQFMIALLSVSAVHISRSLCSSLGSVAFRTGLRLISSQRTA